MKTVAIHLRLATASHRKRMMGIFRFFGSADNWEVRVVPDERHLCSLLQSTDPADIPDGIISGVPYTREARKLIFESGIPFVGIGMSDDEIGVPEKKSMFVANDNPGIGRSAAEFFMKLGDFRTFAFVPDTDGRSWSALRGKAFSDELCSHGRLCRNFAGGENGNSGEEALAKFLRGLEKPAAVFAAWDGRAADVLHASRLAGLRVPEDVSVLGVDDDELICEHTRPALSSVRTDAEGMGEEAARLLSGLISGKIRRAARTSTRPVLGIVERASTRTPAPAAQIIRRAIAFIEAEARNGIRPDDVARHLNVSRRLLDLRFREFETSSISERITLCKLNTAKRLLEESSSAIKDVFRLAGFASITNANKLFKEKTGMNPASWRERHRRMKCSGDRKMQPGDIEESASLSAADERDMRELVALLDPQAMFDAAAVRAAIHGGSTRLFVRRLRGRIVAAAALVGFKTPTGSHFRIEDVVVHPNQRGKGLGRKLMEHLLETLREEKAVSVELTSRPSREAANRLYRSLGFQPRHTNVYEFRFGKT